MFDWMDEYFRNKASDKLVLLYEEFDKYFKCNAYRVYLYECEGEFAHSEFGDIYFYVLSCNEGIEIDGRIIGECFNEWFEYKYPTSKSEFKLSVSGKEIFAQNIVNTINKKFGLPLLK